MERGEEMLGTEEDGAAMVVEVSMGGRGGW